MKKQFLAALLALLCLTTACGTAEKPQTAVELLSLGEKFLLDMDYEQAIVQFTKVIEIEPKNARAYIGAAEAYIALGDTEQAIAVLRQGLAALPDEADIAALLAELTTPPATPTPKPTAIIPVEKADYDEIYAQYMDSKQWLVDYIPQSDWEYTDMTNYNITAYKIFDLDDNGIPELWFRAQPSDEFSGRWGPVRRDFFCAIKDSHVIQLLSGYISGGSIGGDEISIRYDTETQTHVVCITRYAGGFGGLMLWFDSYHYADGLVSADTGCSKIIQPAGDYYKGELDDPDLYYNDSGMTFGNEVALTVYKVNDVQVKREVYERFRDRFTYPISDEFKLD